MLIINTGGTFNKKYNKLTGSNDVSQTPHAIEDICQYLYNIQYEIKQIISKDSLELSDMDRELIKQTIIQSNQNKIIIVHGTDTMNETAKYLENTLEIKDKLIILTGSMYPFAFNKVEASVNLSFAVSFLENSHYENGIYISMGGLMVSHEKIEKNKKLGIFIEVK